MTFVINAMTAAAPTQNVDIGQPKEPKAARTMYRYGHVAGGV